MLFPLAFLAAIAAVPAPAADAVLLSGTTTRSLAQFGQCFSASQASQSRPMWFVASDTGGRLSNAFAPGVTVPYSIRFIAGTADNRIIVSMPGADRGAADALTVAIKSCW